MKSSPIGYVVRVDGSKVTFNVVDSHRGSVAAHVAGVSFVTDVGGLLAVDSGTHRIIVRIVSLSYAEPREVHGATVRRGGGAVEPLRFIEAVTVGALKRDKDGTLAFSADGLEAPSLGAGAYPLSAQHESLVLGGRGSRGPLQLGVEYRSRVGVRVGLTELLSQHVAVLGATGQGKSSFTAAVLQQLASFPRSRIVVLDVNGEFDRAFRKSEEAIANDDLDVRIPADMYRHTYIGRSGADGESSMRIPYYALGRQGLIRLLLPSEKTQRPALAFALDALSKVEWDDEAKGAGLVGGEAVLFDDCRREGARDARDALRVVRSGQGEQAGEWPDMRALASLVAESHSISQGRKGEPERNAFLYGNVAPLVTRINRLIEDEMFREVVATAGGAPSAGGSDLDWQAESVALVERLFGNANARWRVHVVNLRRVPHDLLPVVLGSLLDLFAHELFRRGPNASPPILLVLEEAHHYLRPAVSDDDGSALAYERLAKEGRKFGLSMWLSTQRPSEVSPTVLAQCANWIVFRLTSERDLRAVEAASEWPVSGDARRISGLPRRHAFVAGPVLATPTLIESQEANPVPMSHDGDFDSWLEEPEAQAE